RDFGDHGTKELDITRPRWHEQPGFVYETLQRMVADLDPDRAPRQLNQQSIKAYRQERARLEAFLANHRSYRWIPGRPSRFLGALERVRRCCWWREEMRDLSARVYDLIRRYALETGRRWATGGVLPDPD